ncbi:MAG TPA: hypothetical protein VFS58_10875 [Steroidobacteraceae bacterium]|nr:hypothetical protein [Steroidobacteraceae bacterium]
MKSNKTTILALALCASALAFAQASHTAEDFKGSWAISKSEQAAQVHLALMHRMDGGKSHHESDWPTSAFQGVDFTVRGKRDVQFSISRDAGRFNCEGYLDDGEGAGIFHFVRDGKYSKSMSALGFDGIDEEKQFAMAVHDITLDFARSMKDEGVSGLDTNMLIAFRIHGVTPQFIGEIRAAGLAATSSDKLVAFRIHGVTPEMVRDVRKANLDPSEDQLIAMRIHGVTPAFIADLKARGLKNLTVDQLVGLRIHGID